MLVVVGWPGEEDAGCWIPQRDQPGTKCANLSTRCRHWWLPHRLGSDPAPARRHQVGESARSRLGRVPFLTTVAFHCTCSYILHNYTCGLQARCTLLERTTCCMAPEWKSSQAGYVVTSWPGEDRCSVGKSGLPGSLGSPRSPSRPNPRLLGTLRTLSSCLGRANS